MGPYILWAERETRSAFTASTSKGIRPSDCTASVWKRTPLSRVIRPISSSGWIVPTSLLACITETSTVSGRMAARTASGSTSPSRLTGTTVTSNPSRPSAAIESRTALCSMAVVTRWRPFPAWNRATPFTARLSDSVAPLVQTISRAVAPMSRATSSRASSTASAASHPNEWLFEAAFPDRSVKYGSIASRTRGSTGVVEWQSM